MLAFSTPWVLNASTSLSEPSSPPMRVNTTANDRTASPADRSLSRIVLCLPAGGRLLEAPSLLGAVSGKRPPARDKVATETKAVITNFSSPIRIRSRPLAAAEQFPETPLTRETPTAPAGAPPREPPEPPGSLGPPPRPFTASRPPRPPEIPGTSLLRLPRPPVAAGASFLCARSSFRGAGSSGPGAAQLPWSYQSNPRSLLRGSPPFSSCSGSL